jgi:hypothetical protein
MTFIDVFISELSDGPDPLEIGRGPAPMNRFFPTDHGRAFGRVISMVKAGAGDVNSSGEWVARASKAQILKLIAELYGGNNWHGPGLKDLVAYVDTLDDDKEYALVGSEI